MFRMNVTLKEDVRFFDVDKAIDAAVVGKTYDQNNLTDLPAGLEGEAHILYSRWSSYVDDPEKDVFGFRVYFPLGKESVRVFVQTGPESKLEEYQISYKKIYNYEKIISEYNNKVKEVKSEWEKQSRLRILLGIAVAAGFAVVFLINCIVANKYEMNPAVFGVICFVYVLVLLFAMLISSFS